MGFFRGPAIAFPPSLFSDEDQAWIETIALPHFFMYKKTISFLLFSYPKCHIYLATPKDINRVTLVKE